MSMSSNMIPAGLLNSGLTPQNNQQSNQQGLDNPSIGMPYGPGYTQPNINQPQSDQQKQITEGWNQRFGLPPAGSITNEQFQQMAPSQLGFFGNTPQSNGMSFGKGGMPSVPQQGPEPTFNLPNPVTPPGPIDLTGQIGMPAGPGYMQPGQTTKAAMTPQDLYNQHANIIFGQPSPSYTPDFGQPQIGMPAGPGYMQPTPLPSPTVKAQPTPLPPMTPQNVYNQYANTIFGQPQIGMPAGPGYMQPKAAPKPAPIPQTRQQIVEQVGIRQNQKAPTKVQPSLSTRPTGSLRRR